MNLVAKCVAAIKDWKYSRFPRLRNSSKSKNNANQRNVESNLTNSVTGRESSAEQSNSCPIGNAPDPELFIEPTHAFTKDYQGNINLGVYQVGRTLGKGQQGRVFLAQDTLTEEFVALKVVYTTNRNDGFDAYIHKEIYALRTINHPNVLRLKDVYYNVLTQPEAVFSKKYTVLVLENCSSGDLFSIVNRTGPFSESLTRTLFNQMLSALSACHDAGIYHRDIKLQNILLDSNFQVKIADFGVCAIKLDEDDDCEAMCGTLSYMAPEILYGCPYSGEKADSWSLGILLFILLAGNPPLKVATNNDWWFRAIRSNEMEKFWASHECISPCFPESAREIINRLLVADPNQRSRVRDVLSDPWLNRSTLSQDVLKTEMSKRLRVIEMKKKFAISN